jgi:hypothetical protein
MPLMLLRLAVAGAMLAGQSPAPAPDGPANAVAAAAADLSVGYGMWLWEKRCHTMTAAARAGYDAVIADDLKRLQDASDERLFNAAVSSGREASNDPQLASCAGKDAKGLAAFGLSAARDAQANLRTLPAGYHLTISD